MYIYIYIYIHTKDKHIYIYMCICVCIYIYIYRERERESCIIPDPWLRGLLPPNTRAGLVRRAARVWTQSCRCQKCDHYYYHYYYHYGYYYYDTNSCLDSLA